MTAPTSVDELRAAAATVIERHFERGYATPGDVTAPAGWVDGFSISSSTSTVTSLDVTVDLVVITDGDFDARLTDMAQRLQPLILDLLDNGFTGVTANELDTKTNDVTTYSISATRKVFNPS